MALGFTKVEVKDDDDFDHESDKDSTNVYVSAIVPTTDDPSTPSLSFRVLILGTLWNILLASANSIFQFRTNKFAIPSTVATLLTYPMGIMMTRSLPNRIYNLGPYAFSLNPGPFSIKEHVLISIIASAGGGVAYGVDNVVMQRFDAYMGNKNVTYLNSLAFVMSVQLIGFGLAGIMRRFLVKPAAMYWPGILSQVALFVSFHEKAEDDTYSKSKMSRFKFFWLVSFAFFVYTWIPEYFFPVLQSFSIICLLTSNKVVRFLSSSSRSNGVGLMAFTMDWIYIGGGSLTTPFYASVQFALSSVFWSWIVVPILFFNDAFGMDSKLGNKWSLNTATLYNRNGTSIHPVSLMDKTTYNLNQTAYDAVQPISITSYFAVLYGNSFMSIAAAVSHVTLWYGSSIWKQFKAALKQKNEEKDIHNRLMESYPDVPDWMFLAFLIVMVFVQVAVSIWTPFTMPIWSVFLCVGITFFFLLPIGIITAITGLQLGLNVLSEFVIGLLIPGQTVAVIAFKSLGTNTIIQGLSLIADLKLGHYMKINPVHMIAAQLYGTVVGAIINNCVSIWAESLLSDVLFKEEDWKPSVFDAFYSAGAIWGAIGPQRFFGIGSKYESLLWFFLIGAILPLIPWLGNKMYKADFWHYINIPLLASGVGFPGMYQNAVMIPLFVSWIFQYYIFNRHYEWWKNYNYIFASAADAGVSLTVFMLAIMAQYGIKFPIWAGNPDTDEGIALDYYCFDQHWK